MNKPKFMGRGRDPRNPEDSGANAKWADLARAIEDGDAPAEAGETPSLDSGSPHPAAFTGEMTGPTDIPDYTQPDYAQDDETMGERNGARWAFTAILALAIIGWLAFAIWSLQPGVTATDAGGLLLIAAAVATPPLLLAAIGAILLRRAPDPIRHWRDYAQRVSVEADRSLDALAAAEDRLAHAYALLERKAASVGALAEGSANALLAAAQRIETQSGQAESALRASGAAASDALALVNAIEATAPELDERLSALNRTIIASGAALGAQSEAMEEQVRGAAIVAEEAQLQLGQANAAVVRQMATLRDGARETGEELTAMAELASARVELILERARTAMSTAREGLQDHMAALAALGDQGERSARHVQSLGGAVDEIGDKLGALERDADRGQTRIAGHLAALGAQAERVGGALQMSNAGAAQLVERVETLLLALDSNIREIDESLPAALGRFDVRLLETEARLGDAAALADTMAATADGAARHLEQASETLVEQSRAVEASIDAGDASLARHTAEIAAMRAALDESARVMSRMVDSGAPQLVAAAGRVRDEALAAAETAEAAIAMVVARAAQALAEASESALDAAISDKVSAQIAQIADIADNAVKSAHRATDHLMREMMAIADTATDLEQRMASARQADAGRERDYVAERSAQIIATLNDSAIDVTRWFAQDIGQREWASYLSGDKSLFARRAVKLVSSADMKQIHARYDSDEQFREHVSRYVEEFERMLGELLETKRGHTLAIALLSSDLGKLYVALAQAIERLRVG